MELTKICLLAGYVFFRIMPFAISIYLILSTNGTGEFKEKPSKRAALVFASVVINGVVFLGGHYYHYKDFEILGYIKNIWGMNFYQHDIEYFAVSALAALPAAFLCGKSLCVFGGKVSLMWSLSRAQECAGLITSVMMWVLVMISIYAGGYYEKEILISEICSNNKSVELDEEALITDYIELHNTGKLPCRLKGLYLSDDKFILNKLSLEKYVISAGGYLIIPCSDNVNSFAINEKGENIYLSNENGEILQQVEVPRLKEDISYCLQEDGVNWKTGVCTPAAEQELQQKDTVKTPVLSHGSGFYEEAFELEISSEPGTTIFYTLDGSIPNEWSNVYEDAIYVYDKSQEPNVFKAIPNVEEEWEAETESEPVLKAFIIRAVAVDESGNRSDIVTATYFAGSEEWKDKNIISLVASPDDLFSDEIGIYVTGAAYDEWYLNGQEGEAPVPHFKKSGREWERVAVFELFESSESIIQQNVGIRIQGASTRERAQKRFSIYARKDYDGSDLFAVPLFDNDIYSHSVFLRAELEDALPQSLMEDRDIAIQHYKKVALFLNGEYWYDSYLREKYDAQYFEQYYGMDEDNLIVYQEGELEEGVETDHLLYEELYTFVREKDFTKDDVYERFSQMIDMQNYIDYLCANIYCANRDVNDTHNVVMYRSRESTDEAYCDGKWRWVLYDMDALRYMLRVYYEVEDAASINTFSQETKYGDVPYNRHAIYSALRQNDTFCRQFVLTFMDLMNTNFSIETVSDKLQEFEMDITWFDSFFANRPAYMEKYLAEEFELEGSLEKVVLNNPDAEMGTVIINTVTPEMKNGSWEGKYYTDYPVTVTAVPAEGYEFAGWKGDMDSRELSIEVPVEAGGIELTAEFRPVRE